MIDYPNNIAGPRCSSPFFSFAARTARRGGQWPSARFVLAFIAVERPNALEEGRHELAADPALRECLITWGAAYL